MAKVYPAVFPQNPDPVKISGFGPEVGSLCHVLDGLDTRAFFHCPCEFVLRGVSCSAMHAGALLRACVLLDPCDVRCTGCMTRFDILAT